VPLPAEEPAIASAGRAWPGYRTLWRWHFYAGLLCLPFVLWLSVTGTIYLFKPQVEALLDRPYDRLAMPGPAQPVSAQVDAALAAVPGGSLSAYQLPPAPAAAARVLVGTGDGVVRVYVHPGTLEVLHQVDEDARLMPTISKLHGTLMAGDTGSHVVEAAASWTLVMLVTGLVLWWPRGGSGIAGVLYPRFDKGSRTGWRDLHAVTGFWISLLAIFLIATGLPWAAFWGARLKDVREFAARATVQQDWSTSEAEVLAQRRADHAATLAAIAAPDVAAGHEGHEGHGGNPSAAEREHAAQGGGHEGHGAGHGGAGTMTADAADVAGAGRYAAIDRLMPAVLAEGLASPVLVAPPRKPSGAWTARSDSANRLLRTTLSLDAATGAVNGRQVFADKPVVDRVVGVGIAAHEGALFGLPNQLLGLLATTGLFTLSVSAIAMWWKRRPAGAALGAPKAQSLTPRLAYGVFAVIALIGVLLPLFGATLVGVLLLERLVLRRLAPVAGFLGLRAAS
jgi:uncharacterized iron-regulated membrane protein